MREVGMRGSLVCPVCGTRRNLRPLYANARGEAVLECPRCEVIGVDSADGVALLTDGHYYDASMERLYRSSRESFARTAAAYARVTRDLAGGLAGKRVLDVGAGLGHFLDAATGAGARVEGLDIRAASVSFLRARGIVAHHALLPQHAAAAPRTYEVVSAWNVLEHDDAPRRFCAAARTLLTPGGLFVLETPDSYLLPKRLLYRFFGLVAPRWRPIVTSLHTSTGHRFGFSRRSALALLRSVGFTDCGCTSVDYDYDLVRRKVLSRAPAGVRRTVAGAGLGLAFSALRVAGVRNRFVAWGRA